MDHSLIEQFNIFFYTMGSDDVWRFLEFVGAVWLFFIVIAQRVYIPSYKQSHKGNVFFKKIGQAGIYMQAFLSLFLMADAFDFSTTPHIFLIVFLWSAIMSKGKMYLTLWNVLNPRCEAYFDSEIES